MWNLIKTSLSLLGLFVMIVIIVGLYASLVQDTDIEDNQDNSNLLEQSTTTDQSATSSDFIEINTDDFVPEDTIDF